MNTRGHARNLSIATAKECQRKVYLLPHLVENMKDFGPCCEFSTEKYEDMHRCASGKFKSGKPALNKIHCKFLFSAKMTQEKVLDRLLGKGDKPVVDICEEPR